MSDDLDALIQKLEARIRANDPIAIDDAVKLSEQYPDEPEVWSILAYGHGKTRKYLAAIEAMTRAAELVPREPTVFLDRGRYRLKAGEYEDAIADFSHAFVLCDEESIDWCRWEIHFMRAEALVQLGRKAEALADLAQVPDSCTLWTIQLRSKVELLALCGVNVPPSMADDASESLESLDFGGNLFIDDRSALAKFPDEDEAALTQELGEAGLAKADASLLKCAPRRWGKVARILWHAMETDGLAITDTLARVYLRRLIALVDAGAIEVAGNIYRPRFSEVRLPERE